MATISQKSKRSSDFKIQPKRKRRSPVSIDSLSISPESSPEMKPAVCKWLHYLIPIAHSTKSLVPASAQETLHSSVWKPTVNAGTQYPEIISLSSTSPISKKSNSPADLSKVSAQMSATSQKSQIKGFVASKSDKSSGKKSESVKKSNGLSLALLATKSVKIERLLWILWWMRFKKTTL